MNKDEGDIIIEAECGTRWYIDYEPQPEHCTCEIWKLGIEDLNGSIDWGSWVDEEGNNVE